MCNSYPNVFLLTDGEKTLSTSQIVHPKYLNSFLIWATAVLNVTCVWSSFLYTHKLKSNFLFNCAQQFLWNKNLH